VARAGDNDLILARLGTIKLAGTAVPSNTDFRSLASELGVVLAPRLGSPAETIGFGGFQFAADVGFTGVGTRKTYWRALRSSPEPDNPSVTHGSGVFTTAGVFVRKGIWFPLPSFEIGLGAVHLVNSHMWAAQGYAKFALVEGYTDAPWPSLAVRAAGSRLMGESQLDLTVLSFDGSLSKEFGIAGTVTLSPFLGYNLLFIIPRSDVIDKTPQIDPLVDPADLSKNFVFAEQDAILRHRLFLGAKLNFYIFSLTLQGTYALAGASHDSVAGANMPCPAGPTTTVTCYARDNAGSQVTFESALALQF
jgi:hypothetical protein